MLICLLRPPSGSHANVPSPPSFGHQRADVQQAIHARVGTKWTECSRALNYTMQKQNMLVYLQEFFVKRPDLKILYYSGGMHPDPPGPVSSAPHHRPISLPPPPPIPTLRCRHCHRALRLHSVLSQWPAPPHRQAVEVRCPLSGLLYMFTTDRPTTAPLHTVEKAVVCSRRAGGGGLQRGVRQVHLRHHQGRRTRGTLPCKPRGSPRGRSLD